MRTIIRTACAVITLAVAGLTHAEQLPESTPGFQRGIERLDVLVNPISEETAALGFSGAVIEREVKRRLRAAGIKVEGVNEKMVVTFGATREDAECSYDLSVVIRQPVALARDPSKKVDADTWKGAYGGPMVCEDTDRLLPLLTYLVEDGIASIRGFALPSRNPPLLPRNPANTDVVASMSEQVGKTPPTMPSKPAARVLSQDSQIALTSRIAAEIKPKIDEQDSQLAKLNANVAQLTTQLSQSRSDTDAAKRQIAEAETKLTQCSDLQQKLADAKTQLDHSAMEKELLNEKLKLSKDPNDSQLGWAREEVARLRDDNEKARGDVFKANAMRDEALSNLLGLQKDVQDKTALIKKLTAKSDLDDTQINQLNQTVAQRDELLTRLQAQLADARTAVADQNDLKAELTRRDSKIAALHQRLDAAEEGLSSKSEEVRQLKIASETSAGDAAARITRLQSELTTAKATLDAQATLPAQLAEANAKVSKLQSDLQLAQANLAEANTSNARATTESASNVAKLQQELSEARSTLASQASLQNQLSESKARVAKLEAQLVDAKLKLADATAATTSLKTDLDSANKTINDQAGIAAQLKASQDRVAVLETKLKSAQDDADQRKAALNASLGKLVDETTLADQLKASKDRLKSLEGQMKEAHAETVDTTRLQNQVATLEGQLKVEQGKASSISSALNDARSKSADTARLQDRVKNLEAQLADARSTIAAQQSLPLQLKAEQDKTAKLNADLQTANQNLETAKASTTQTALQIDNLQSAVKTLQNKLDLRDATIASLQSKAASAVKAQASATAKAVPANPPKMSKNVDAAKASAPALAVGTFITTSKAVSAYADPIKLANPVQIPAGTEIRVEAAPSGMPGWYLVSQQGQNQLWANLSD